MTPFYDRLPDVGGFGVERTADILGAALAIGATAGVAAHAVATGIHQARHRQLPVVEITPIKPDVPTTPGTGKE